MVRVLYGDGSRQCPVSRDEGMNIIMLQTLTERLFDDSDRTDLDPLAVFEEWYALAQEAEPNDPHAFALATVDDDGLPDVRMVLLNARDARGFCFFTNFESAKGGQLHAHPKAAMLMHWKSLRRQVRVRGNVEVVSPEEADAYLPAATRAARSPRRYRTSRGCWTTRWSCSTG